MSRSPRTRMDTIAPAAGFVEAAMAKLGVDPKWRAIAEWPEICGPTIAARTIPERIVGRVLYVRVPSSAWAQDLVFVKADLLAKLRARVGLPIDELRFVVGRVAHPAEGQTAPAPPDLSGAPDLASLAPRQTVEQALADVADEDLRQALRGLGLRVLRG